MPGEGPDFTARPSDIIRKHVWLTTQPMDEPAQPGYVQQLFEHLDMDDHIVFASDYPHWDFDDPTRVLPASVIGAERREQNHVGHYFPHNTSLALPAKAEQYVSHCRGDLLAARDFHP